MVNSPLIRPYVLGGVALGGGTLDSHDHRCFAKMKIDTSQIFAAFFSGYHLYKPFIK